jgi:hypothetical protein
MHTGREGQAAMPYLDAYPIREVDILLISQYVDPPLRSSACSMSCFLVLVQPKSHLVDIGEVQNVDRFRPAIGKRWTSPLAILSSTINTMFTTSDLLSIAAPCIRFLC